MTQSDLFGNNSDPESPICYHMDDGIQAQLLEIITKILDAAPFYRPVLPRWGTPFSVQMSNCGSVGWMSDKSGYRYQSNHPETGQPWPPIPQMLLKLWAQYANYPHPPEACLINYYANTAKMGLHQDKDEEDFDAPVLSVSLGNDARFRLGGTERGGKTQNFPLRSGDVMLLGGANRLAFHGVDKIYHGTSDLLAGHPELFPEGGRLNLTLRRVTKP